MRLTKLTNLLCEPGKSLHPARCGSVDLDADSILGDQFNDVSEGRLES